jgi:hypothetical protein
VFKTVWYTRKTCPAEFVTAYELPVALVWMPAAFVSWYCGRPELLGVGGKVLVKAPPVRSDMS